MKIISYCDHCHGVFESIPKKWFRIYRGVIEHMIIHERPSLCIDDEAFYDDSDISELLKILEDEDLILTTECNLRALAVYPLAVNIIEFEDDKDVEYYHVCKSFSNYGAQLIDEKVEEE